LEDAGDLHEQKIEAQKIERDQRGQRSAEIGKIPGCNILDSELNAPNNKRLNRERMSRGSQAMLTILKKSRNTKRYVCAMVAPTGIFDMKAPARMQG
jgi:hypothetical protein